LRSANGKGIVRIEDRLDAPVDDVWSALTDPQRLGSWLGDVDGDLHLGGEFHAHFFASGWEGTGRIDVCDPPHRLLVLTKEAEDRANPVIEATRPADGGRPIRVGEEREIPADLVAAYGAGVQVHVEDLAAYLAGGERCEAAVRFDELFPAYQEL